MARMMETTTPTLPPSRAKALVLAAVAALVGGALYLIAVRGDALMIDLAKIGQAFCF